METEDDQSFDDDNDCEDRRHAVEHAVEDLNVNSSKKTKLE